MPCSSTQGAGIILPFVTILLLSSCGSVPKQTQPASLQPSAITVITVAPQDVPIYGEYAAQTYARDTVDVRGRVDSYLEKGYFRWAQKLPLGKPFMF